MPARQSGAPWIRVSAGVGVAITVTALAAAVPVLLALGRSWWCGCGRPDLWSWHIWSRHNSQHLIDPYTFTHMQHGLLFFAAFFLLLGRRRPVWRFALAVGVETLWEIAENTSFVIDRYREATISLDYFGDSVVNSLADIVACAAGYGLAAVLPLAASVVLFAGTEMILLLTIRDSLILNVWMLISPAQALKRWQSGG